jgi:hypothetical protein
VRYLDLPEPIRPLLIKPPLRVLVVISSPTESARLDTEGEWKRLGGALQHLEQTGQVTLERLDEATLPALQRRLRQGDYHVFHFIGHGGFDPSLQDGILMFEDEQERGRPVSGQSLGVALQSHPSIRLAFLNACEGARAGAADPFGGTAQSLVQQGIPSVIAMQFEISDEAALTFASEFYGALADGYPVDAALGQSRQAVYNQGRTLEWATPVLYLRTPDGRIFDIERTSASPSEGIKQRRRPVAKTWKGVGALLGIAFMVAAIVYVFHDRKTQPIPVETHQILKDPHTVNPSRDVMPRGVDPQEPTRRTSVTSQFGSFSNFRIADEADRRLSFSVDYHYTGAFGFRMDLSASAQADESITMLPPRPRVGPGSGTVAFELVKNGGGNASSRVVRVCMVEPLTGTELHCQDFDYAKKWK